MSDLDKIIRRSEPGAVLGEGPLWSKRDRCVYWVDILSNKLHACYLDGRARTWDFPEHVTWVIERDISAFPGGGFIAGLMSGFAEVTLEPFSIRHIANPYPHEPENRMNDAKADDRGRIWAGSMHKPITKTSGAFYRLIVCAAPQTLGDLRSMLGAKCREKTTAEIDKDFTNLPTDKLVSSVRSIMFD